MRFIYLRLFLTETEQPPILVESGNVQRRLPRVDYLNDIFNRQWIFTHRGTDFVYVPVRRSEEDIETIIFGRIGKQVKNQENAGPDEKFELTERRSWRASNLILNSSSDKNGQKLAVEERGDVGKPLAIINSMINHINTTNSDLGWNISVNSMTEKTTFWQAVEKYKGQITRAEFTYITPNVLGIRSVLSKRLKEYREKENAQEVTVILSEPKGDLSLESEEVRDAVDYTSEGGGSTKLKVGREIVYDSQDSDKAKDFETNDEMRFDDPKGRQELVRKILAILYLTYPLQILRYKGQGDTSCLFCPAKSSTTSKPPTIM